MGQGNSGDYKKIMPIKCSALLNGLRGSVKRQLPYCPQSPTRASFLFLLDSSIINSIPIPMSKSF